MSEPDRLSAEKLRADIGDVIIGREIVVLEKTTSTNDSVWQLAQGGAAEGLVVFAEHQTAGRGQRGNPWESTAHKGLWFSALLRPKIDVKSSARLTEWAARAVAATLRNEFGLSAVIKSPNDIYIEDRKIAGVLVEMRAQKNAPHVGILGIGVNVNQMPADFSEALRVRATSLAMLRGRPQDRQSLGVALLRTLDHTYAETFG
jgi:BirA family biotin operon repressor/biotin-[acetyl-CoA-carboxylase] ligase